MAYHPPEYEVQAWHHGALSLTEGLHIENHVEDCAHCQAVLAECKEMDALFSNPSTPTIPSDLSRQISLAVQSSRDQQQALEPSRPPLFRTVLMATLAATLALTIMMVPIFGVGLQAILLKAGLALKELVFLAREMAPVFKALFTLLQYAYLPLLIMAGFFALFPLLIARRAMVGGLGLRNV